MPEKEQTPLQEWAAEFGGMEQLISKLELGSMSPEGSPAFIKAPRVLQAQMTTPGGFANIMDQIREAIKKTAES